MDKSEYPRLLCEAYINDTTKFRVSDPERPKARGYTTQTLPSTPPTEGEDLESIVRRILPKPIAVSLRLTGSRSAAQDPQKTFGTWPHLISHTNVQLWVGEMVGGEITAVRQQPVHNNWQLCVCVRNSQTENQQRWYSCVVRCYLTTYQRARRWNHPDTIWQSLYQQHLNLNKVDLVDLLKSHQRSTVSVRWATVQIGRRSRHGLTTWATARQCFHGIHWKNSWAWRQNALILQDDDSTLMIRLPICWTQHQRLLFFRSWTTATLQLISLRKRKTMACFFF